MIQGDGLRALPTELRKQLEGAVLAGRHAAEAGVRAAFASLGVGEPSKPSHLNEGQARLRRALRAKCRQLGGHPGQDLDVLVWDAAYEQWHRLLFARFLAENELLRHPEFDAPVTLGDCEELAEELGEPDGWSVAARFAAEILPGIFRLDDPCVKVRLAPEHRAALERVVVGLPVAVFAADDSLGWVYQHWQSERKDQVNASEVKIGGADVGPVTQLFTENYMVRFLLENSLGAWWAARHPDSPLLKEFDYLRFDDDGQPAAGTFEGWPDTLAEVTVMDPCCGSGHFLVEAFGMLWRMRAEEEGLDRVEAQDAVLRDNLFGLELEPRCVQIAMFAVALAAWKQGDGYRKLPTPNIACSGIPAKAPLEKWTALADGDERLERALERLHILFKDADTLGSLIDPRGAAEMANAAGLQRSFDDVDFDEVAPLLEKAAARETDDPATAVLGADAAGIARAASLLSRTYTLAVTNPPFLARIKHGLTLTEYVDAWLPTGRNDLAAVFLDRVLQFAGNQGDAGLVMPDKIWYLGAYKNLRQRVLDEDTIRFMVLLGPKGFRTPMFDLGVCLASISRGTRALQPSVSGIDLSQLPDADGKAKQLVRGELQRVDQQRVCDNPDSRFSFDPIGEADLLSNYADSSQGICTGDIPRFGRKLWEVPVIDGADWVRQQSTVPATQIWAGRQDILKWQEGSGELHDYIRLRLGEGREGAWLRGLEFLGSSGVVISQTGRLYATLYSGDRLDNNAAIVVPNDQALLPALWAYCSSDEYHDAVRSIDPALKVTNLTLLKVPFDVERWRQVAAEEFPDGLPEPLSDDPTQWLFEGRPEVSTEPLQVGVGRLLGYRWPEQPDGDDLDELADEDGLVCLPPVGGELPAADRLTALLAKAYGDEWSPGLVRQLLEQAESKRKNLKDWLRDDYFKHHCAVFDNRPFVWHITDGRKDGFSALVNYHRLDRAGLEKLTYTYLGDWIERQRAQAADDVAGADLRLAAAQGLKGKLELILEGEKPYDIYVRWKELHEQPIGWVPDLDDGVRLNIRPFVEADVLAGPKSVPRVHWKKDRGKNPDGSERHNDLHYTIAEKQQARQKAGSG